MNRLLVSIVMGAMLATGASAQNAASQNAVSLAKEQQELNNVLRKTLNAKPTKEAKQQAKQLKKQGWIVPAGERSLEQQWTESQLLAAELTADDNGAPTRRFIQHTGFATAGTYNAAYAAARSNAQVEIASMLETKIAAAMQGKLDNAQRDAVNATTVDKYNQRVKAIVDESLNNSIPVLTIYRVLPNNNFELQVRLAFDKKEVAARLKRDLQKELEAEGDELNVIVDSVLNNVN